MQGPIASRLCVISADQLTCAASSTATTSLSVTLRQRTAYHHLEIENLLGLPNTISTRDDYSAWLGRFFGFYEPLECCLDSFAIWKDVGLDAPRSHTARLLEDLKVLEVKTIDLPRASPALLPDLSSFAHALGARYVLEGATLGGQVILRAVEAQGGSKVAGATQFFGGRGKTAGPMWQRFRKALDEFGSKRPELSDDVASGAERTFRAMSTWFAPFCAVPRGST